MIKTTGCGIIFSLFYFNILFIPLLQAIFCNLRQTKRQMTKRISMVFILLFAAFSSQARIDATAGHTVYYKKSAAGIFVPAPQVYWQVNPGSLHFFTNEKKQIVAQMRTDILFVDDDGVLLEDHFVLRTPPRADVQSLATLNILEQRQYVLDKPIHGNVRSLIVLTDMNDTFSVFRWEERIDVAADTAHTFFSGLKLLAINDSAGRSIPLCANFLDDGQRILHYTAELYNAGAEKIRPNAYPLTRRVRLSKKPGELFLPDMMVVDTFAANMPVKASGSIPIGRLSSGNYYLNISIEDKYATPLAARSMFFQRMNTHPDTTREAGPKTMTDLLKDTAMEKVTVLNLEKTFLAKYNMQQLRSILKMLLPVADPMQTNTINGFLKKPDEMYIKYFIYNYFLDKDPKDPGRAWKEYSDRIVAVNKKFNANGNAGFETDRGFIYMRYGKPTDVITVTGESGSLPYEIWQYNNLTQFSNKKELANSLFLFYKRSTAMADYMLLHSTVPGEVVNMAWRSYLFTGNVASDGGFSLNSRADQYFGNR